MMRDLLEEFKWAVFKLALPPWLVWLVVGLMVVGLALEGWEAA